MSQEISTALRLLAQEREVLALLAQLAKKQEAAMVAGDLTATEQYIEQEAILLQREAHLSSRLAGMVRSSSGLSALLSELPEQQRVDGEALVREVKDFAKELRAAASRLNALAQNGLERVDFVYKSVARALDGPVPYRAPGRGLTVASSVMSQRV